ncbi:MAG: energy transducer TonB [Candidatus Angelobacter sp.]
MNHTIGLFLGFVLCGVWTHGGQALLPVSQNQAVPSSAVTPDSTRLEPIKTPKPDYPLEARQKGLQGRVVIKVTVSEAGDVESTEVISGNPILAKAAAEAFKKWKFKPYIRNGKPITVNTNLPFDFAFSENVRDVPDNQKEAITTSSDDAPPKNTIPGSPSQKYRISSGIAEGQIRHKVEPAYPLEAKLHYIEGTVLLQATIDKSGNIKNLKPISGPQVLVEAAVGAVQQWRYRPYLLKGNPVEVETTIKITFRIR